MLELALINLALLVAVCALPKWTGISRWSGRRSAKALLRNVPSSYRPLRATVIGGARRIGETLWPVFQPQLFAGLPKALARGALAVPAVSAVLLLIGGPAASEVPVSGADGRACSETHDHSGSQMTTAPNYERLTTPAVAGFLTET